MLWQKVQRIGQKRIPTERMFRHRAAFREKYNASKRIASSRVENPKAKEIASNSKRKKSSESNPRKTTNFKTKSSTPACTLPLSASGAKIQRTPQPRRKKFS